MVFVCQSFLHSYTTKPIIENNTVCVCTQFVSFLLGLCVYTVRLLPLRKFFFLVVALGLLHIYVYTYIHTHTHIYMYIYICIYICMYVCMYVCIRPSIYTYVHTYIHTYVHTYIHTYIHTSQLLQLLLAHACIWLQSLFNKLFNWYVAAIVVQACM
jgi:hypothetical protein